MNARVIAEAVEKTLNEFNIEVTGHKRVKLENGLFGIVNEDHTPFVIANDNIVFQDGESIPTEYFTDFEYFGLKILCLYDNCENFNEVKRKFNTESQIDCLLWQDEYEEEEEADAESEYWAEVDRAYEDIRE